MGSCAPYCLALDPDPFLGTVARTARMTAPKPKPIVGRVVRRTIRSLAGRAPPGASARLRPASSGSVFSAPARRLTGYSPVRLIFERRLDFLLRDGDVPHLHVVDGAIPPVRT